MIAAIITFGLVYLVALVRLYQRFKKLEAGWRDQIRANGDIKRLCQQQWRDNTMVEKTLMNQIQRQQEWTEEELDRLNRRVDERKKSADEPS